MITYNDIYEAARKERYSDQLQPISKNFVKEVSNYLKEKKEVASKEDDIFSDTIAKTKKQLENAVMLFRELIRIRRKKVLELVRIAAETGISKQDFENMFDFEKDFFECMMRCVESSDKQLNEILNGKEEEVKKNVLVIFKKNVEEFLDLDGEKIGPFEEGQIANLSSEIAKILIEDSKVEIVER